MAHRARRVAMLAAAGRRADRDDSERSGLRGARFNGPCGVEGAAVDLPGGAERGDVEGATQPPTAA